MPSRSCYFLLNFVAEKAGELDTGEYARTCYFLLNFVLLLTLVTTYAETLEACYFLSNFVREIYGSGSTDYRFIILLFSFEFCS